ncbi:MAG TPA: isochorismatase family protein, partial [Candidatus Desulfofervidus auxilii]|nr:isochorismatase family protein [Candidatus Desulfofervidus auxilii]
KEQLLQDVIKLLKGCSIFQLPTITTEQYPQGLGPTLPEIDSFLDETNIFSKLSFSGYTPEVKDCLEKIGKKKVILIGLESHVCVFQTCRDLLKNGYQVFIPIECVSSRSPIHMHNALELMQNMGAWITNVETVLFDLLKTAQAPEFKSISSLVK